MGWYGDAVDEWNEERQELESKLEKAQTLIVELLEQNEDLRGQIEVMKFHMNRMSFQIDGEKQAAIIRAHEDELDRLDPHRCDK